MRRRRHGAAQRRQHLAAHPRRDRPPVCGEHRRRIL